MSPTIPGYEIEMLGRTDVARYIAEARASVCTWAISGPVRDRVLMILDAMERELASGEIPAYGQRAAPGLGPMLTEDLPEGPESQPLERLWLWYETVPDGYAWHWEVRPLKPAGIRLPSPRGKGPAVPCRLLGLYRTPFLSVTCLESDGEDGDAGPEEFLAALLGSYGEGNWALLAASGLEEEAEDGLVEAMIEQTPEHKVVLLGDESRVVLMRVDPDLEDTVENLVLLAESTRCVLLAPAPDVSLADLSSSLAEAARHLVATRGWSPEQLADPAELSSLLGADPLDHEATRWLEQVNVVAITAEERADEVVVYDLPDSGPDARK